VPRSSRSANSERSPDRAERMEQILDAAEALLREHGIAHTTVLDVARALGLTHAAVYRYFADKVALQEAVAQRWLHRITRPLAAIAEREGSAEDRLREWARTLARLKRHKVLDDPKMFAAYSSLAGAADRVATAHVAELQNQLARILEDGCRQRVFRLKDIRRAAAAVQSAMLRFHHPLLLLPPNPLPTQRDLDQVLDLIIAGLKTGSV
jgi:AcrR family transcriptional regulator